MKLLGKLLLCALPWPLRRRALERFFGFSIHPTARIGLAWVFPRRLVMEEHAFIGHLTVAVHLDLVHLGVHASLGKGNWITGFPSGSGSPHFAHQPERRSELLLGAHSAITNRHLIDCTSPVVIGRFTTFAGFQSQILSHSIDLEKGRQSSAPVTIGDYCFVGTNCVLLGGSALPACSVLGAKSLLNKAFSEPHTLYAGCPAEARKPLPRDLAYFHRARGYID